MVGSRLEVAEGLTADAWGNCLEDKNVLYHHDDDGYMTCQTGHLKFLDFIACKLNLNKADKNLIILPRENHQYCDYIKQNISQCKVFIHVTCIFSAPNSA